MVCLAPSSLSDYGFVSHSYQINVVFLIQSRKNLMSYFFNTKTFKASFSIFNLKKIKTFAVYAGYLFIFASQMSRHTFSPESCPVQHGLHLGQVSREQLGTESSPGG